MNAKVDEYGREYDYSPKQFQVLCRGGWKDVEYVYRHKTNKPLYEVLDDNAKVCVTEDHSLFDENKKEIKPSEITSETKLEYVSSPIQEVEYDTKEGEVVIIAKLLANGNFTSVPTQILNGTKANKELFLETFKMHYKGNELSKTIQAGLLFLTKGI